MAEVLDQIRFVRPLTSEEREQILAWRGEREPPGALVLFEPNDLHRAIAEVKALMETTERVLVYGLPATLGTMLTSAVFKLPPWEEVQAKALKGWDFLMKNRIPKEEALTLLCKRYHNRAREDGEFDQVIHALSSRTKIRRLSLRIMYGKIRKELYPNEPVFKRKPKYPWWKHLKKNRK